MKVRKHWLGLVAGVGLTAFGGLASAAPFGDEASVKLANDLWALMVDKNLAGDNAIITRPYKGMPPHGMILELLELPVTLDGVTGDLVVKRNYGGDGLSIDDVINDPNKYLQAVTIMLKRESGYDAENQDWFYVKYGPDGSILTNPKGAKLAGRVAKGMPTGCIACHKAAPGGDFVFNHDRYK
ncbi:hypothetical protein [Marinobacterium arenosum]|uniref:hypothetical protein n=1 Tax=Marinobacterium arenosum TaxID=2862496 RepID=UPI002106EE58|nr:hypothetical protein [Marinobacterium arenosum]